ncbi:MAG: nucleotide pyrophosphohydrolase [archaeon]
MELKVAQKTVDDWISQFEDGYWPPLSQLAALVEETGELAREINNIESKKLKKTPGDNLKTEIGDVLFALICIANSYNISLVDAFRTTMSKYEKRDQNRWKRKHSSLPSDPA